MERPEEMIQRVGVRAAANREHFNVAGIIFTYQCSIACRHCLFACRPARPHVAMSKEDCLEYLHFFYRLPRVIHLAGGDCFIFYDHLWEFHLDPYGNLQTNCGVVLGNAKRTPLAEIVDPNRISANPIVRILADRGPLGLLEHAAEKGLEPRDGCGQKCEVCFHARSFLRPHYPEILCPDEVYDI